LSKPTPHRLNDALELDYYRRPGPVRRFRRLILWLVFLTGCALLALVFWLGRPSLYQAGPVSTAHALFDNDCARCHTTAFQPVRRLAPSNAGFRSVADAACLTCHDGPLHNAQQESPPSCSSCHQEHRGRPQLAQVASDHCTACHANLRRRDGKDPHFQNVSAFADNHPEFALWRDKDPKDLGQLSFNHQVHLNLRARGLRGPDGEPLAQELDCQSCHTPDRDRRSMQPIRYDQHCARCHPLVIRLDGPPPVQPGPAEAAERYRAQPVPHRSPEVVRAALRERLTELVRGSPDIVEIGPPSSGPLFPRKPPDAAPPKDERTWIDRQLRQGERILFDGAGGCRYCHTVKAPAGSRPFPNDLPEFEPTRIPQLWFKHSVFNHDSHRSWRCTECHPAATSRLTSDVLLPRIDTCRQCHNPRAGARSDCIHCHHYHDRDREHGWKGKLTIGADPDSPP
jgi:Cytochrome c7 and related cytochrome c